MGLARPGRQESPSIRGSTQEDGQHTFGCLALPQLDGHVGSHCSVKLYAAADPAVIELASDPVFIRCMCRSRPQIPVAVTSPVIAGMLRVRAHVPASYRAWALSDPIGPAQLHKLVCPCSGCHMHSPCAKLQVHTAWHALAQQQSCTGAQMYNSLSTLTYANGDDLQALVLST